MKRTLAVLGIVLFTLAAAAQARDLEIIWIDTEGGAATLFIAPSGESMLIDTGYPNDDRDATRINAAVRAAGLNAPTLENAIAPAANMGDNKMPNFGYSTPAATGTSAAL